MASSEKIRLAINGSAGRMGLRLIDLATQDDAFDLLAAMEHPAHPQLGQDSGIVAGIGQNQLLFQPTSERELDVVIDFSSPSGAEIALDFCLENGFGLVMATTGLSEAVEARLTQAASEIPVVWAPNMSLAVNLTMSLAEIAARSLKDHPAGVDVEIIERHHRYKADSPSGTALKFGSLIGDAMGIQNETHGREGLVGERPRNEIGYHAVRTGDDAGQHTILFGMLGELVELRVAASNRDCYAAGALAAAKYIHHRDPGMYSMKDVLGI